MNPLVILAGPKALAQLREYGLRPQDVAVVPAAAGGPKGLIFQKLDQWLFGCWLPSAPRERSLIGASIGAWRMAAACHADPISAFQRLGNLYTETTYPPKPSAQYVTDSCRAVLDGVFGGQETKILNHPHYRLHVLTVRGRGLLSVPRRKISTAGGFGLAVLGNAISRSQLANHLARVVFSDTRDPVFWLKAKFDAFDTEFAALNQESLPAALLASGTLPFTMEPVSGIPGAPVGTYWDGGLIDYHLALPYSRLIANPEGGLVLYPHFTRRIVPGWFDKTLPWRHAARGSTRAWLDNLILVAPSPAFLQTLPRAKLPDRKDFHYYGLDHAERIRKWKQAIGESERLRDALASFVEKPDLSLVQPF
jgi:predicted acylesterase/phospholipase RssA